MSKKLDLQKKAEELGIEGFLDMTIPQLEKAIDNMRKPVIDMADNDSMEHQKKEGNVEEAPPITLTLEDVNGYLNIIGIMMVDDVRVQGLSSHFMKMIQARNPHIQSHSPKK